MYSREGMYIPNNHEAEQAVLGAVLLDETVLGLITLEPNDFYYKKHQIVFGAMQDLMFSGVSIDIVSLISKIGAASLQELGGTTYLMALSSSVPTASNIKTYEAAVKKCATERKVIETAQKLISDVSSGELNKGAEEAVDGIVHAMTGSDGDDDGTIQDPLIDLVEKMGTDTEVNGVCTGLDDYDRLVGNYVGGDLHIIAARPSMGKTAVLCQIGLNVAAKSEDNLVVIFSLEMSTEQLLKRFLSNVCVIDGDDMRNPKQRFGKQEWQKIMTGVSELDARDIRIFSQPEVTVGDIRSKLMQLKRLNPNKNIVVYIDYLQLIKYNGKGNEQEVVSKISRGLKVIAMSLNIPITALSQLSRGVEQRQDKRPMLSDLRSSGSIEQDASVVTFLYRDDYYDRDTEQKGVLEFIVAKNRDGSLGTASTVFMANVGRVVNIK